jgi:hypothetical protein
MRPSNAAALTTAAEVLTRATQRIHAHPGKNTFLGLSPDFLIFFCDRLCRHVFYWEIFAKNTCIIFPIAQNYASMCSYYD